jgi:putative addiction module component (TIGR02574 family)
MSIDTLMPALEKLSVKERLDLIERIEDTLPEAVQRSEIPEWHIEILKKRLADATAHPGQGVTWEEFKAEIRRQ